MKDSMPKRGEEALEYMYDELRNLDPTTDVDMRVRYDNDSFEATHTQGRFVADFLEGVGVEDGADEIYVDRDGGYNEGDRFHQYKVSIKEEVTPEPQTIEMNGEEYDFEPTEHASPTDTVATIFVTYQEGEKQGDDGPIGFEV